MNENALRLEIKLMVNDTLDVPDENGNLHVVPWDEDYPHEDAFWGVYVVGRDGGMRWHIRDYPLKERHEMERDVSDTDWLWRYAAGTPDWPWKEADRARPEFGGHIVGIDTVYDKWARKYDDLNGAPESEEDR